MALKLGASNVNRQLQRCVTLGRTATLSFSRVNFSPLQTGVRQLVSLLCVAGLCLPVQVVAAPSGTFSQGDWSGGVAASTAAHPGDQTGWTTYSSKDSGLVTVNGGADLQLGFEVLSSRHTTSTDFAFSTDTVRRHTSTADFANGSILSNIRVGMDKISLDIAALSPAWTRNSSWDSPDRGQYAAAALADLDGDGDSDLMLGQSGGVVYGYKNIGSAEAPLWESTFAWDVPDNIGGYAIPALADLDGDGDFDLMIGESAGVSYGYENIGDSSAPVWSANSAWNTPYVGGQANPTLADLDGDGDFDLLIGISSGFVLAYENTGTTSSPVWTARPAWDTGIDVGLWAAPVAADLDGDGDIDLMVGSSLGVAYGIENTGNNSAPTWASNAAWDSTNMGSSSSPALADMDDDGDLDILAGQFTGTAIGYENIGSSYYLAGNLVSSVIDAGQHLGFTVLDFIAATPASTAVTMDIRAGDTPTPDGSWTAWQINVANGGDISVLGQQRYVQYRANLSTGDANSSPDLYSVTVNVANYASGSNSQIGLASVHLTVVSQVAGWTYNSSWNAPNSGYYSKPAFIDLDDDGDFDLLVGDSTGVSFGYENTGGNSSPVWVARSGWNVPSVGAYSAPAFADIDNDGDYDLLIGEYSGISMGFENTGSRAAPVWTAKPDWNTPDIGTFPTPAFADLDNDGDYDLVIGNSSGSTVAYENTGSATAPEWTSNSVFRNPFNVFNNSAPVMVDLDADGDYDMLMGGYNGQTRGYENTGTVTSPVWTANSAWNVTYDVGNQAAPAVADLDGDLDGDLLIGSNSGLIYGQLNNGTTVVAAAGSYSSSIIDSGLHTGYLTLDYTGATPVGTTINVDVRAGDTPLPDGSWTGWQTGVANGGDISALGSRRYLQYRLNLSTSDTSVSPFLEDITINRERYITSASLVSSAYDSADAGNLMDGFSWQETLVANSDIQLQARTAADAGGVPGVWSGWQGPDGTSGSYWNSANSYSAGCVGSGWVSCTVFPPGFRDGVGDQWFQYRLTLVSDGKATATLANVDVDYASENTSGTGGVSVSAISGPTTENGGAATFSVVLNSAPSASVTMALYSDNTTEGVVSSSLLTFDSGNWNIAQTVTLTGMDDDVDDGDVAYTVVVGSTSSADPNYDDINPGDVAVINIDNDVAGVTVTPTSGLVTNETGSMATFTIVLDSQPTADVAINLASSDTSEGVVTPAVVTLTSANWSTPQIVTLTGVDDAVIDGTVNYTILTAIASADGNYNAIDPDDVSASNGDNDAANVIINTPFGSNTSESGGVIFVELSLSSQPTDSVEVTLSSSDISEGSVIPGLISFTPDNWDNPWSVTVIGVNDSEVDGDVAYSIITSTMTSADSNFNGIDPVDINVINQDDDGYSVIVSPASGLVTTENGGQADFQIRLGAAPSADVTINLASSDATEGSVWPASVTFVPGDPVWRGKTITVTGLDDREFDNDQVYSIVTTLVSSDSNYSAIDPADVTLTNIDNNQNDFNRLQNNIADSAFGTSVSVADVNCDAVPDLIVGTVGQVYDEVYVYHGSAAGYASTPDWVGRDTAANTNFGAQLHGVKDINQDGCDDLLVGAITTTNNRGAAYLFYGSPSGLPDADSDGVGRPSDAVWRVTGDQTFALLGSSFTSGDFNGDSYVDIAVSARAYDNAQNDEGRIYVFFNSASGLPDADADGIAQVSEAGWVFESDHASGSAGFNQGLAVANVNGDAYSDLIIGVYRHSNGQSREGRAYAFYGSASGFNDADADGIARPADADWTVESDMSNAYLGYALANAGDLDGDGADELIVSAYRYSNGQTSEGAAFVFYGASPGGLPDADADGIARLSDAGWQVESDNAYSDFGNWLSSGGDFNGDGFRDVLVGARSYNADGRAYIYYGSGAGLSTSADWVGVATDDSDNYGAVVGDVGDLNGDGRSEFFVSLTAAESSPIEDGEGAVFVYLSNVQTAGITATPMVGLSTTESGGTDSFSVVLNAPPTADVTIGISSDNSSEGIASPTTLTFTPANWMMPQTVTVTGVNDAVADGDTIYNILLAAAVSGDADYNGLTSAAVTIVNVDNDVPASVTVASTDTLESGSSASVTFSHTGEIITAKTVYYTVAGSALAGADYVALSGSVVIPAGSASVTLPIDVVDDGLDENNETVLITLVAGPDYSIGSPSSATATITDDDSAGVLVSPSGGLVTTEAGGSDSFTVSLGSQPANDVTINVTSNNSAEGLTSPASLVFSPAQWNVPQVVSVVGQDDILSDGEVAYAIVTTAISSDPVYSGIAVADVAVVNRDDETLPRVTLTTDSARVAEGGSVPAVFTVTRTGATSDELRVFFNTTGTAVPGMDFQSMGTMVAISAGESSQTFSLVPLQDSLEEGDETVSVSLAGGSAYIIGQPSGNTVIITDDDVGGVLPLVNLAVDQTVGEGSAVTVSVGLSAPASSYPVTVPYSVSGTAVNPADHDAVDGVIIIASGTSGSMVFNVVDDGSGDPGETVVFTLGTPNNALAGARTIHTVTITEDNVEPGVNMTSVQNGDSSRLIVSGAGNVTVSATVSDANPLDSHSFDWSLTNNALVDIDDADPATFVFDPVGLTPGFYKVRLIVSDDGTPVLTTVTETLLEVVATAPILTAADSDNDGVADNVESFDDSDGDGIADYLDASTLAINELQLYVDQPGSYLMRTEVGLALGLGDVAFAANADGAIVTPDDITAYGAGEGNPGTVSGVDSVVNTGGYFDFIVTGLPQAGQSVAIVVPQLAPLPAGAVYRKYDPDSGWRDFVVDTNNDLASAPGAPGLCPQPGDAAYVSGLAQGHYCVQLTIEDGGPNDTDGQLNRVIEDPGNVTGRWSNENAIQPASENDRGGLGASVYLAGLVVFLLLCRLRRWPGFLRRC